MSSKGAILVLLGGAVALGATMKTNPTNPNTGNGPFDPLYQKYAAQYGIPWQLIKAVAMVESGEDPRAVNRADPSFGLMQILAVSTREDLPAQNELPAVPQWPLSPAELYDPDKNIGVGSAILAWNIQRYGALKGIAVYNSWGARNDLGEPFRNQPYVDKVKNSLASLPGGAEALSGLYA